jgi:hypothetical protein
MSISQTMRNGIHLFSVRKSRCESYKILAHRSFFHANVLITCNLYILPITLRDFKNFEAAGSYI